MTRPRCVSFPNRDGKRLYGILHEPTPETALGICVLLLSPGIKGRVGPHRLYLKMASRLVPLGFHVLRFDFHGLGDSEGRLADSQLADMYNSIQSGLYVEDTIAAMNWVGNALGIHRFVGSGLCGGSITALLAARRDSRLRWLVGLGMPTSLEGGRENWARHITQGQLSGVRTKYIKRLRSPESWRRLLLGRSEYSVIWRAFTRSLFAVRRSTPGEPPALDSGVQDNANPLFADAFKEYVESARPLILLFGTNDRLQFEFAEKFEARHKEWVEKHLNLYSVHMIAEANHVMSDDRWVASMLDIAESWLVEQCSRHPNATATLATSYSTSAD